MLTKLISLSAFSLLCVCNVAMAERCKNLSGHYDNGYIVGLGGEEPYRATPWEGPRKATTITPFNDHDPAKYREEHWHVKQAEGWAEGTMRTLDCTVLGWWNHDGETKHPEAPDDYWMKVEDKR